MKRGQSKFEVVLAILIVINIILSGLAVAYVASLSGQLGTVSEALSDISDTLSGLPSQISSSVSEVVNEALGKINITAPPPSGPTYAGEIKIGMTVSLKGKYAHEGEMLLAGVQTAIRWVNEHGGVVIGDKRYNLSLVYYDDESDSKLVPELYSRLIERDKVDFLLGPYSSGLTMAAEPVAEEHGMILISVGGASDSIYQRGYKYAVQAWSPASHYFIAAIDMLASLNDPDIKVALIYENSAFATIAAKGAKEALQNHGISIVYEKAYEKGATEFSSIISEAVAAGANVLIGGGHFADGTALTQQSWELGWKLKAIILMVAPTLPDYYEQLQDVAENVIGVSQWEIGVGYSPSSARNIGLEWYGPTQDEFINLFKEISGGVIPDYHAAAGANGVLVLVKAIEEAGIINQDAVRSAFNRLHLMTFFGEFKIDPSTGLQIGHKMIAVQWQNGEKIIVAPPEAATGELIYPAPNWWSRE